MTENGPRVKATQTSFKIIESLESDGPAGVSQLSRRVGLSKSSVYKHVKTLEELGYLVREGDDYYLSNRFLGLGQSARERLPMSAIRGVVHDLAETTGQVSSFIAHEGDHGIYAIRSKPPGGATVENTEGAVVPLHATAGGKAILAFLPREARADIVDDQLSELTERTITDPDELERELQSIRDRRVAFEREEFINGLQCVASPVLDADQTPSGAISVTGSINQMSGKHLEEDVAGLVTSAAKSIENRLLSAGR